MEESTSQLIKLALAEDIGTGDVTSRYFVPEDRMARGFVVAKAEGVLAGVDVGAEVFRRVDAASGVKVLLDDGAQVAPDACVMEVTGKARSLLTAERTAINFLQHLSGVATKTAQFVEAVRGTGATILDTRKTTPGWRHLEKSAVVAGGGTNHRMGLYDRAMVKDNHLVAEGGIGHLRESIERLKREHPELEVEVEAERVEQVEAFLEVPGVDHILLDNMDTESMARAVALRDGDRPYFEASGGVSLDTVRGIAETGVDFISVGVLTHSAVALDLSLDFMPLEDHDA